MLQQLYSPDGFALELNGELIPLQSQILAPQRSFYSIGPDDQLLLHVRRSLFEANCTELIRNTLYIQLLRDTSVVYGDEQRSKQEHLITHQIFYNLLQPDPLLGEEWLTADLTGLLQLSKEIGRASCRERV